MATDFTKPLRAAQRAFGTQFFITPVMSQPNAPMRVATAVYTNKLMDIVPGDKGMMTTYQQMLGIIVSDFAVTPRQGDKIIFENTKYDIFDIKIDGKGGADIWLIKGK